MSLKVNEARALAMENAKVVLADVLEQMVQYGDAKYALAVDVDGETRFVKVEMTVANNKDTVRGAAFDPDVARAEWLADKEFKAQEKAQKDAEKAKKAKSKTTKTQDAE